VPDILIERNHTLGMPAARQIARQWVQRAGQDYGLECSYEEGAARDVAQFARAGIDGSVEVTADSFMLRATLGALYGNFSALIEQKLNSNLDELLGAGEPPDDDAYNDKAWR
jgi:putative polyhydroxyalkanoate system protein